MSFCVVLHNMIVEKVRPLHDGVHEDGHVQDFKECHYRFSRDSSPVQPGPFAVICDDGYCLSNAYEYMKFRCLIYERIVNKKYNALDFFCPSELLLSHN